MSTIYGLNVLNVPQKLLPRPARTCSGQSVQERQVASS